MMSGISPAMVATSLSPHIVEIVAGGAEEEMTGPDTGRVVAAVTDVEAWIKRPICQLITDPMGNVFSVNAPKHSIALRVKNSLPRPAIAGRIDLRPKPLTQRLHYYTGG